MSAVRFDYAVLDRMVLAVELVRDRVRRASAALEAGGVPYAVIGGNAVGSWVARIDPEAVRNTQDVDILLRRSDLDAATAAMATAGFTFQVVAGIAMFLDGPAGTPRSAVHVLFSNEKVRAEYPTAAPDVSATEAGPEGFRVLSLEALVRMKLTSYRRKDQVHIQDLHGVGLIDATWPAQFPPPLGDRLQTLLDDPDG